MIYKKIIREKNGFKVVHINRRRACRFVCIECLGWEEYQACNGKMLDGTVCPLASYRNMADKQNAQKRDTAIRKFCLECMGGNSAEVSSCKSFFCPVHPYRQTAIDKTSLFDFNISDDVILGMGYERFMAA